MGDRTAPVSDATKRWWTYERPAEHGVISASVDVEVRDGTTIACELRRPARDGVATEGAFPTIVVELTPYVVLQDFYRQEADYFVTRGYNTVVAMIRGVGGSGGTWDYGSFRQAGLDGHDLIEWLVAQPWSDGRVGMYGESYGGQTTYGTATERPTGLLAIAPMQSPSSLYHDVIYPGGVKSTERGVIDNWPDIANLTSGGVIDADAEFAANRAHPTYDEFWRHRSHIGRLGAISIPVLAVGGWDDSYFRSGTIRNIEALPANTWAIYGPWAHFFPVALVEDASWSQETEERAGAMAEAPPLGPGVLLAWFDHWVAGRPDVPVPPQPTFTSYEGPVGVGAGWRDLDGWDGPEGEATEVALVADHGKATFRQPAPSDDEVDAITFTSAPLLADEVLVGHPSLRFTATLDATDAHFYVELLEVGADGGELLVNDGFLAASHRRSHTDPEPVVIGEPTDLRIAIRPDHHRFRTGSRVRVRVSGGAPSRLTSAPAPVTVIVQDGRAVLGCPGFRPTD